jgi:predicted DNA-binding antitoxin AbrB/MazE fold protein
MVVASSDSDAQTRGRHMAQVAEAIFSHGVLRPVVKLHLQEEQRVRLLIEPVDATARLDRVTALRRLRAGVAAMHFSLTSPLPSRDELHDRV